jgi:hypothetical protein
LFVSRERVYRAVAQNGLGISAHLTIVT